MPDSATTMVRMVMQLERTNMERVLSVTGLIDDPILEEDRSEFCPPATDATYRR